MKSALRMCLLALLLLPGCGGDGAPGLIGETPEPVTDREASTGGNYLDVGSFPFDFVFEIVDRDEIPATNDRRVIGPQDENARYLLPDDKVFGVNINGDIRAYPHNVGWWHEIMNDVVGGIPIVVSFCPLTSTGLMFDGRGTDGRMELGVSGLLFNNNLIMYDRRDGESSPTLYPQMIAKGVSGPRISEELKQLPMIETTWRFWQALYPETKVISGLGEEYLPGIYTSYPYGTSQGRVQDYRTNDDDISFENIPNLKDNPLIDLFPIKSLVLGVRFGEIAKAYPFQNMGERAVINDIVGGNPIVVLFHAEEDFAIAYEGSFEGAPLTFDMVSSNNPAMPFFMKDRETGTVWDMLGSAKEGINRGAQLKLVPAHQAMWFAWATFWQNTGIY